MKNEKSLEKRNEKSLEKRNGNSSGISLWQVAGGAALLLGAALVVVNLPDIKRYIKIRTM